MTTTLVPGLLWFVLGLLAGTAYWRALRWSAGMLVGGRSVALPIALQLLRLAAVGTALAVVATRWGWPALLLFTGGLMLARVVVVRSVVRTGGRA